MTSLDVDDLERYYDAAYEEAQILLGDGVPVEHLVDGATVGRGVGGGVAAALERATGASFAIETYPAGQIDDPEPDFELPDGQPPLLSAALDLEGLPFDEGDTAEAVADHNPVEIVLLCNLRYVSCRSQLETVGRRLRDQYPQEVRLIWAPWYDLEVAGNETAPRLHAAALCAERQGAGWKWIEETQRQVFRGAGEGNGDVDELIDAVAKLAQVDRASLDDCLAALDDDEVNARVQAAVDAGVHHAPALVISGRVYVGGFTDWRAAAPLIDAELAPGLLEQVAPSW